MVSPVDRLKDVALEGSRLYLVFEFVDKDLRGFYSELKPEVKIDMKLVKVCVCVVCVYVGGADTLPPPFLCTVVPVPDVGRPGPLSPSRHHAPRPEASEPVGGWSWEHEAG